MTPSNSACQYGRFSQLSVRPYEIKVDESVMEVSKITDASYPLVPVKITLANHDRSIPVFIVNKLSGPQFGEAVLEYLYKHLNPIQVIDLLEEGIERLKYFKGIKDLKVVVGGGDGTMGGLVDPIFDIVGKQITLIPMPLGTGNDLCRALGWGDGISTRKDIRTYLKNLEVRPLPTLFDRWQIRVTSKKQPEKVLLNLKMLLYFGIGLDAKFSYQFNLIRKKFPSFFKSRVGNKFFYSQMGTYNLLAEKKMDMREALKITSERNGKKSPVTIEHFSENVVCQNTSFWGGGCFDMWDSYKDAEDAEILSHSSNESYATPHIVPSYERRQEDVDYKPQTHSDKLLEMMSFRSLFHMGQIQIGLAKADRLTQANAFTIEYDMKDNFYVHVDGEGYLIKEPCRIEVTWSDQIYMNINKVKTPTSKYLSDILRVLNHAVEDKAITPEQKSQLYEKFVHNL